MDDIGRLIRHAGARDTVPKDRFDRAQRRVQSHWEQVVAENRRSNNRVHYRYIAIAASVIVAVVSSTLLLRTGEAPGPVAMASVDRVLGEVLIDNQPASVGDIIAPGALVETADDSRIALRLADGQSLRIDTLSRVFVHTANKLTLRGGGVYIDTEHALNAGPVLVMTAFGQARDVGTQFQVRLSSDVLSVGVREGQVEVTRPNRQAVSIDSGRVVDLNIDGSESIRGVANDDPVWAWVETVAPEFDLDGATLEQYLRWYTRERGLRLVWSDPRSEQKAKRIKLRGSIAGTSLEEGFRTVQRTAPFKYRFDSDGLWVSLE